MKKVKQFLAPLTFVLTTSLSINAQTNDSKAHFGIKGGVNFSNLYSNEVDDNNLLTSYNAGVYFNMPIGGKLSFQPEFLYSRKGAELVYNNAFANGTARFKLNYLEIPLLFKANITNNINLHFGPYLAYLIDAQATNETQNGTFDFEKNYNNDDFSKFDAGLSAGVGFDFNRIGFGVRYNYGLKTVGKEKSFAGTTYTTPDAKNSTLSIYTAIRL